MLVGYMHVSSDGDRQTTALQRDARLVVEVDDRHFYENKASGAPSAVCRTFGAKRTTLIETLARAGWSGLGTAAIGKELECPSRS